MFRVVRTMDTAEPAYFLLCDHKQCMEARRGPAVVTNSDDYRLAKKQFLKAAMDEGWWIDLEGAYCPPHAQDLLHAAKEAQEQGQQAIHLARPGEVVAFGKGR
jgi:hypothetical protein